MRPRRVPLEECPDLKCRRARVCMHPSPDTGCRKLFVGEEERRLELVKVIEALHAEELQRRKRSGTRS